MADPHLFTHGLKIKQQAWEQQRQWLWTRKLAERTETKEWKNETEGENVETTVSTGDNHDFDANSTEVTVVHSNDRNAGTNDLTGGNYSMETERLSKSLSWGAMKTVSATMGTIEQCDGEPTEDEVVYNRDGTIGFWRAVTGRQILDGGKEKERHNKREQHGHRGSSRVSNEGGEKYK
jgi:hypothetical protein